MRNKLFSARAISSGIAQIEKSTVRFWPICDSRTYENVNADTQSSVALDVLTISYSVARKASLEQTGESLHLLNATHVFVRATLAY